MRAGPPQESGGPPPANPPRRSMSKEDNIEVTGTVLEKFPSGKFSVQIDHERVVLAHLHLNSIDIDPSDGNFILSFRHTSSIVKVDRHTAAILWTLGGTEDQYGLTSDE